MVWQLRIEQRIDDESGRRAQQQRITIRRCTRCDLSADDTARTRTIVDYELLLEGLRELLCDHARHYVRPACRRIRHHESYRSAREIRLCAGGLCHRNKRACSD